LRFPRLAQLDKSFRNKRSIAGPYSLLVCNPQCFSAYQSVKACHKTLHTLYLFPSPPFSSFLPFQRLLQLAKYNKHFFTLFKATLGKFDNVICKQVSPNVTKKSKGSAKSVTWLFFKFVMPKIKLFSRFYKKKWKCHATGVRVTEQYHQMSHGGGKGSKIGQKLSRIIWMAPNTNGLEF